MAYDATVVPVMIASPSDVHSEREIIREVVQNWNYIHSPTSNIILMPVGWETHATPELGARPQEFINERVLKECDLLVGVFWTRIGSPTGVAASGTVEEIERHVAAGKPAMIYFSAIPVVLESVDADQYAAVRRFKDRLMKLGLIETYDNLHDFRNKLSHHLALAMNTNPYLQSMATKKAAPPAALSSAGYVLSATAQSVSREAQILLKTAARDKEGMILKLATVGGRFIQAGGLTYGAGGGRDSALWEAALQELVDGNYVTSRGHKGEVFQITKAGWDLADTLPDV